MTLVFLYGSHMHPDALEEVGIAFSSRQPGVLEGFRLSFNVPDITAPGAGLANILGDPKDHVEGAVYEIAPEDLEQLDRAHGVGDGRYNRVVLTVTAAEDARIQTHAYVGVERVYHDGLQPTHETMANMLAAADILDDEYVSRLRGIDAFEAE